MGNVNKVTLVGNLGNDPEIRIMNNGEKVAKFSIATTEYWKNKTTGERNKKTEWHNIVVYNDNIIRVAEQFLSSGSLVYVEGALQTRDWTDAAGNTRYTTEVVIQKFRGELTMLGGKRTDASTASGTTSADFEQEFTDEIPF